MPAHISHLSFAEDALREAAADAELFEHLHREPERPVRQRTAGPDAP
jgi:hypothetical protein